MPVLQPRRALPTLSVMLSLLAAPALAQDAQVARVESTSETEAIVDGAAAEEGPMVPRLTALIDSPDEGYEAASAIVARIDLSDQRMYVYVSGRLQHVWPVSTGRKSYGTPTGRWNAEWLSPRHRSRKYDNAPMPWAVFFYQGYAVHGTNEVKRLGRPASHGCVRLDPNNAKTFFQLVKTTGMDETLIAIVR